MSERNNWNGNEMLTRCQKCINNIISVDRRWPHTKRILYASRAHSRKVAHLKLDRRCAHSIFTEQLIPIVFDWANLMHSRWAVFTEHRIESIHNGKPLLSNRKLAINCTFFTISICDDNCKVSHSSMSTRFASNDSDSTIAISQWSCSARGDRLMIFDKIKSIFHSSHWFIGTV